MNIIKKNLFTILLAVFVAIVVLAFYSPMYAFQEGLQIFMFDTGFLLDTVLRPGGVSDYLGRFLVQFFMYLHYLAIILVATVCFTQLAIRGVLENIGAPRNGADVLSTICALSLMLPITDFNVLYEGCLSILLAVALLRISINIQNKIALTALALATYWIAGGWGSIIFIVGTAMRYNGIQLVATIGINLLALVLACFVTKRLMLDDGLQNVFEGADYNRFTEKPRYIWYIPIIVTIIAMIIGKLNILIQNKIANLVALAIATACVSGVMVSKYDREAITFYQLDKMVRYKQWGGIIELASKNRVTYPLSVCYVNLALNEKGLLDSQMFHFYQCGPDGLATVYIDSQNKAIVNSEIYFRLGVMNTAERLAIDSQESCNTFQKSARQYKRLAEVAIIRNDKALAIRFLKILQKTIFYRAWALRAEEYVLNPDKVEPLADWKIKPLNFDYDIFFSSTYKSELFHFLYAYNLQNRKLFNYYSCYLMLEKDIDKLYTLVGKYQLEQSVGTHLYEAVLLYVSKYKPEELQTAMNQQNETAQRFQAFYNCMNGPKSQNQQAVQNAFGDTFWYYYFGTTKQ
ncbi:MAG: DUF6057 family protein [Bacteroidales bacterium]|nr:DUF6057 family protein [Bacteroidales bacterium]